MITVAKEMLYSNWPGWGWPFLGHVGLRLSKGWAHISSRAAEQRIRKGCGGGESSLCPPQSAIPSPERTGELLKPRHRWQKSQSCPSHSGIRGHIHNLLPPALPQRFPPTPAYFLTWGRGSQSGIHTSQHNHFQLSAWLLLSLTPKLKPCLLSEATANQATHLLQELPFFLPYIHKTL